MMDERNDVSKPVASPSGRPAVKANGSGEQADAKSKRSTSDWRVWAVLGLAAVAATMLSELSQLLADIVSGGHVSYSAATFTSFTLSPFDSGRELADAVRLWCSTGHANYVLYYVAIDMVLFAPSLAYLLYRLMGSVGLRKADKKTIPMWPALALLGIAWVETSLTGLFVMLQPADDWWYALPRFASAVKWIAVGLAVAIVLTAWAGRDVPGSFSLQRERGERTDHGGSHWRTVAKLAGPIIVLALFLALVALPAGGPLDQLADVIRNQISELTNQLNPRPLAGSVAGLMLFFLALFVATAWTTGLPARSSAERGPRSAPATRRILLVTAAVGVVIGGLKAAFGLPEPLVAFVPFVLFGALALIDLVARKLRVYPHRKPDIGTPQKVADTAQGWVAILPGLAVLGSGVGLLRATFKPLVLGLDPLLPWLIGTLCAVVVAVVAGGVTEMICRWLLPKDEGETGKNRNLRLLQVLAVGSLGLLAIGLAIWPEWAAHLTSGGTIAACLGMMVLIFGGLHHLSQRSDAWDVTARLRLGRLRTPWVGIVLACWLAANLLNGAGGYHDVRAYSEGPPATYADSAAALDSWMRTVAADERCREPAGPERTQPVVRLVMVAAPGGGIRAAYWTGSGLDAMTGSTDCGAGAVFAVSGVSGGSVGAAAWLAAPRGEARATVTAMASDNALAASTASLFLRDALQPFIGAGDLWRDRSAVMEDEWTSRAKSAFGSLERPTLFSAPRAAAGWQPVVMLNGSSVTDGCRVLITNVAALPSGPSPCEPAAADAGAFPGSLDAMTGLRPDLGPDGASCDYATGRGDIRLVTAALLSARFPVVSSSGVIDRCVTASSGAGDPSSRVRTTYDVDGGYYENSGLLSVLQFWDTIRPIVQHCNSLVSNPAPVGASSPAEQCPTAANGVLIQPWIVVLDNHYQSAAAPAPVSHQNELMLPVQAMLNSSVVVGQENLEETARIAMDGFLLPFPDGSTATATFARIGPSKRPTLEAPLGWVLSQTARCGLDEQLRTYEPQVAVVAPQRITLSPGCSDTGPIKVDSSRAAG